MIWFSKLNYQNDVIPWGIDSLPVFLNNKYDIAAHAFSACSCSSWPPSKISPIAEYDAAAFLLTSPFLERKAKGPIFRFYLYLFFFEKVQWVGQNQMSLQWRYNVVYGWPVHFCPHRQIWDHPRTQVVSYNLSFFGASSATYDGT